MILIWKKKNNFNSFRCSSLQESSQAVWAQCWGPNWDTLFSLRKPGGFNISLVFQHNSRLQSNTFQFLFILISVSVWIFSLSYRCIWICNFRSSSTSPELILTITVPWPCHTWQGLSMTMARCYVLRATALDIKIRLVHRISYPQVRYQPYNSYPCMSLAQG